MKIGRKITFISSDGTLWNTSLDVKIFQTSFTPPYPHMESIVRFKLTAFDFLDDAID